MGREEILSLCLDLFGKVGGAAVCGNIDWETGGSFDFKSKERQYNKVPGLGLFQMEPPMQSNYREFLAKKGLSDSAENQIKYVHEEVQQGKWIGAANAKLIRDAFSSGNVDKATMAFCNLFERPPNPLDTPMDPNIDRRIDSAKKIYENVSMRTK
jgi:hypothetical protein